MKAGEISIDLTINDRDFSVRLKNGERILSQFSRQMDNAGRAVQTVENHFSSFSTKFRHFMIMVASARFALLDINQVFLSLPRSIIKTSGELERMTKLMEGLSKATTEAARKQEALTSVDFLFGMAKTAPFQMDALTDSFVKLKSGGIDPMNGSMQALVDSVAKFGGDSQKLHRASIAIQQMAGKGVVSMEELRQQLGEAVPNAIEMMAVGAGKSMSKMVAEISKGQVEATSALERMFAVMQFRNEGAAAAMMDTWVGLGERLKTEWQLAQIQMGKSGGFETAKETISQLIDSFDGTQMRQLGSDLGYVVAQMTKGIQALIQGAQKYYEYIKLAGQAFVAYFVASRVAEGASGMWTRMLAGHRAAQAEIKKSQEDAHKRAVDLHKQETEAARNKYAQIQREARRHAAAVAASENRLTRINTAASNYIGDARRMEAQARAVDLRTEAGRRLQTQLQREAAQLRSQAAAVQRLTTSTIASRNAYNAQLGVLRASEAAQAAYIARLNATVVSMGRLTLAQRIWATTSRGLGTVFNALGGWIGVITIALAIGIMKWMDYAQATERAAQRAKDAAAGVSSAKSLAEAEEALNKLKYDKAGAEARTRSPFELEREEAKADLKRILEEETRLQNEVKLHRENLAEDAATHQENLYLRDFNRNANAIRRHYQTLALTEEEQIKKQTESKMALAKTQKEKDAIRAEEQRQIAEMTRRNAAGVASDIITYNQNALADVNKKLLTATGEDQRALEKIREFHERSLEEGKERLNLANKIGTDYEKLFGDAGEGAGGKSKAATPLEALLDRVADKMAVINGELDKKGSGDLKKILNDLEQIDPAKMIANGKRMTKQEVIDMIMPGLIQGEWRLEFEKSFEQISDTIGNEMLRVSTELDGGRSSIERLRDQLNELGISAASAGDPERVGRITQLIDRLGELQTEQSKLSLRDISLEFTNSISSIRASLSDDPNDSIYAKWSEDISKFQQKIVDAKLDTQQALEAQKLFADYVKVTYERLQRDTETPMQKMAREWTNTTKNMQEATAGWVSDASEAFTDFVMTGKADFSSLAESIIRDLIRMQLQAAMGNMIKGVTSGGGGWLEGAIGEIGSFIGSFFANGGVMTEFGSVPLRKYANGGIAYKPQMAIFGEGSRPEAYVPLPDGRTIPVTMTGGGQSVGTVVNVNVHEAPGTRTSVQQSQDDQGNMTLDIMIEQIEGKMASNLARGRSQIGTTMENVYGLNRAAGARR